MSLNWSRPLIYYLAVYGLLSMPLISTSCNWSISIDCWVMKSEVAICWGLDPSLLLDNIKYSHETWNCCHHSGNSPTYRGKKYQETCRKAKLNPSHPVAVATPLLPELLWWENLNFPIICTSVSRSFLILAFLEYSFPVQQDMPTES